MARLIFGAVFLSFLLLNALQERGLKRRGLDTAGARPVDRRLFALGKLSTLLCWLAAALQASGVDIRMTAVPPRAELLAAALFLGGFGVLAAAYHDLGDANRTGLPSDATRLRTSGVYSWSRNPLYLGLYLMTAGAVLYSGCPVAALLGAAAVFAHHRIALAEEAFLAGRFGEEYERYRRRVGRYL